MEATGRDDGGHGRWSRSYHREQTGSSSFRSVGSSRSGTVVSTATYTSRSSASRPSSLPTLLVDLESNSDRGQRDKGVFKDGTEIKVKHIQMLVQEFFRAPAANCSTQAGNMRVLERWFVDLGVAWIFHLFHGSSARRKLKHVFDDDDARSWILALNEIMKTIHSTTTLFWNETDSAQFIQEIPEEEPENESGKQTCCRSDHFQIARFFQQTMLKMLGFVDVIVIEDLAINGVRVPKLKLSTLLHVYVALSTALSDFRFRLHWPYSSEVERIESEMVILLSAKEDMAHEAIWSTLEKMRTRVLESMSDSSGTQDLQASSEIHKLTYSVVGHITFMLENHSGVAPIVSKAARLGKYVPHIRHLLPFDIMIMEMMTCLEQKLVNMSESLPDQGLRFLFLLNNSDFMQGNLRSCITSFPQIIIRYSAVIANVEALLDKVEGYMERYLEVSWAPVLSCLFNPTHRFYGKNYSLLSKFDSEFRKTYTTQKLWKVPNPVLRKRLREAILKKIVPNYKDYIEINDVTTPTIAPHELQWMLQELFEG